MKDFLKYVAEFALISYAVIIVFFVGLVALLIWAPGVLMHILRAVFVFVGMAAIIDLLAGLASMLYHIAKHKRAYR